jgi:hypothetical protein
LLTMLKLALLVIMTMNSSRRYWYC